MLEQRIDREVDALSQQLAAFISMPDEQHWRAIQAGYRRLFMIAKSLGSEEQFKKPRMRVKAISQTTPLA